MPDDKDAFVEIAENTAKRGYREGWTVKQFSARQVVKTLEEVCEALLNTGLPASPAADTLLNLAKAVQGQARTVFDDQDSWGKWADHRDPQVDGTTDAEMADVLVCLANYATVRGVNLKKMAMHKSEADIIRGAR